MFHTITLALSAPLEDGSAKKIMHLIKSINGVASAYLDAVESKTIYIKVLKTVCEDEILRQAAEIVNKIRANVDSGVSNHGSQLLYNSIKPVNEEDISNQLIKEGWVIPLKNGEVAYGAPIINLMNYINYLTLHLYQPLFITHCRQYNPIISFEHLTSIGYSDEQPEIMYTLHPNHKVADHYLALQTALCYKIYIELFSQILPENRLYTVYGQCFRNEPGRAYLIESTTAFSMREFVFVGDRSFVETGYQKAIDLSMELLDLLHIAGGVFQADDPFFITSIARKNYSIPHNNKLEIRCQIPGRNRDIAVASSNLHGNFFTKSFNIHSASGEELCTGCTGYGMERIIWAFLQQNGLDSNYWPKEVSEAVNNSSFSGML